jgi:pilus assembly protein CpaD
MTFRLSTLAFAAAGALGLSGCATTQAPEPPALVALTPTEQFSIEVAPRLDEILLAPSGGLSPTQHAALGDLADRWREFGEGPIVVHAASAGPAGQTAQSAARALEEFGVPATFVQLAPFEAAADAQPVPVRVGFTRLHASAPQCADLWENLSKTRKNEPHKAFGCATTANMAAQIADPRDLLGPRASTPADAVRRGVVLDKYRKGEATSATRTDDERGYVSEAAN